MSRDDLHFRLRIPTDLKDRVQAAAESNKRSMTAEIISALETMYPQPRDTLHMYVDQIRERLDEYEAETDPQRRLFIQLVIEGMAAGHIEPISISDMEQHADQRRK